MYVIEPCCSQRQMAELRKTIGNNGKAEFEGYGDMSLTELLPALLTSYNETELLIAAPSLPDQAAEVILTWAKWQWARMDGKGKIYVLRHLTIVADLSEEKSPTASGWLKDNPFGERMTLINHAQEETAVLLPDIAIIGPVNMRYGRRFTATATTVQEHIDNLWKRFTTIGNKPAKQESKQTRRSARKKK